MEHIIPEMTDPLGRAWIQPARQDILVGDDTAIMTQATCDRLPDYSATLPSGVYPGKMWKRIEIDAATFAATAYLGWYGADVNGRCSIHWRKIVIGDWQSLYGVYQKKPQDPATATALRMHQYYGIKVKKPGEVIYVSSPT